MLLLLMLACVAGPGVAGEDTGRSEMVLRLHRVWSSLAGDLGRLDVSHLLEDIEDGRCRNETRAMLDGLSTSSPWAARMADSWGRTPAGALVGSEYDFGNYDECVQVIGDLEEEDGVPSYRGQYCLVDVTLNVGEPRKKVLVNAPDGHKFVEARNDYYKQYRLHCGVCIPSGCSARDLKQFLSRAVRYVDHSLPATVDVRDDMCHYEKQTDLRIRDVIFLFFIGIYSIIILTGTVYSLVKQSSTKGPLSDVLVAFSLTRNLKKLGKYKASDLGLDCLYGLKFIFMSFILLGHTVLFQFGGPILNDAGVEEILVGIPTDLFKNNQLFVDGFFLIGGFLMCRLMLQELDKKKNLNFGYVIFLRYFRLTPAYAVVIAFYATVFFYTGSGPLWDSKIALERDRCLSSWWTNLLYINNYVNSDTVCMFQSWYVAADLQLFLVGLPLVYALWRWPTPGRMLLVIVLTLSTAICFVNTLVYRLDPLLMMFRPEVEDITVNTYFENVYMKTHFKGAPYFIGVLLGYVVYHFQMKGIKLKRATLCAGWAVSAILVAASVFTAHVFYRREYRYRVLDAAFFAGLDKLGWCAAISWLVFACATKHGGILEGLLSSRWLVPLSRVTYSAYLVNGIVILHSVGSARVPTHFEETNLFSIAVSQLVLTYLAATLLTLTFESPLNAIQKIFFSGTRESSKEERKIDT